jgi:hypothetical protein
MKIYFIIKLQFQCLRLTAALLGTYLGQESQDMVVVRARTHVQINRLSGYEHKSQSLNLGQFLFATNIPSPVSKHSGSVLMRLGRPNLINYDMTRSRPPLRAFLSLVAASPGLAKRQR